MKLYTKSAFTALLLTVIGSVYAAESKAVSPLRPELEEESPLKPPSRSNSPGRSDDNALIAAVFGNACSSSHGNIQDGPLYPQPSAPPYPTQLDLSDWNTQNPSNPSLAEPSAPFLQNAPQAPQYRFLKGTATRGFLSSTAQSLLIGGIAGLGCYALTDDRTKDIAFASACSLIAGCATTLSANSTLNTIDRTRRNLATDPGEFNRQISEHLRPMLNSRVTGVQRQITDAVSRNNRALGNLRSQISFINRDHSLTQTLPGTLERLQTTAVKQALTRNESLKAYQTIAQRGIHVTQADMDVAATRFDTQINTAREAYNNQLRSLKPGEEARPLSEFLPREIKLKCPLSSSFAASSNDFDQFLGHVGFSLARNEVTRDDALKAAGVRHESEKNMAYQKYNQAEHAWQLTKVDIAEKQHRLTNLLNANYGDRSRCDVWIAALELQIKEAQDTHAATQESLQAQKDAAGTPTQGDVTAASETLVEACNSENKSWYQGYFAGGLTTAIAATAALLYAWFR